MTRALTHAVRPGGQVVDFFYGVRRIAELRWSAEERDRHEGTVGWLLVTLHFTGEEDWDAGTSAFGDERRLARLMFSSAYGQAWQREAGQVRDITLAYAISRAREELFDQIAVDLEQGLEPFPELNDLP